MVGRDRRARRIACAIVGRPPRRTPVRKSIRVIRGFPNFPRNAVPNLTEYISERPEMIPHDEKSKKAKTRRGKFDYENKIS